MQSLDSLVRSLDDLFDIQRVEKDPAFSQFVPLAYEMSGLDWQSYFESDFNQRFNGLMMRGDSEVETVFLSTFPSVEVLDRLLADGRRGDLLFLHHPVDMWFGDPRREVPTTPCVPIAEGHLDAIQEAGLSIYTCHIPMDLNWKVGTTAALVEAVGGRVVDHFMEGGYGPYGAICEIAPISTEALTQKLIEVHGIPYVDSFGPSHDKLERIAIVAGVGARVDYFTEAEHKGAQAYVSGEVRNHIQNEYGSMLDAQIREYMLQCTMSMIGTSHAGSEFVVMRTQMKPWLEANTSVKAELIAERHWWR